MLSLYNIRIIAKFELKTLFRSWFLRIFMALSLVFLVFFNLGTITNVFNSFVPRFMYALPSSIPYMNIIMFNFAQAVIAVFLASDFFKRDRKLNTTEAIYIRSMSNSSYILGKAIGILIVFIFLNAFILSVAGLIHYFFGLSDINIYSYFLYPLVISFPTLVFIVGLTFLLMGILKNQAFTFIILLGYIATTIFYLGPQVDPIYDYTTMWFPLMYSDFVGFGNEWEILLHRGAYLFIGIALIFLTIKTFQRLPQEDLIRKLSLVGVSISLIISIYCIYSYVMLPIEKDNIRTEILNTNDKYATLDRLTITDHKLGLLHKGKIIECKSKIKFINNNDNELSRYLFNLNPGLIVSSIQKESKEIEFVNENGIILIENQKLSSGSYDSLTIKYSGSIDERLCYLDIEEEYLNEIKKDFLYRIGKRYSFIEENYVLLTNENQWYPNAGIKYKKNDPFSTKIDFTNFELSVETKSNLEVISQGAVKKDDNGNSKFKTEDPVPFISLIIGEYEKRSIIVDSINYNLFIHNEHTYFDEYLDQVSDTLDVLIKELKNEYETELDVDYKFNRFSLVEVPIQFTSYKRVWTSAQESIQPEMVFLTENAFNIDGADFKLFKQRQDRFGSRSNEVILETEKQAQAFSNFIKTTLFDEVGGFRFRSQDDQSKIGKPFSVFPNYYSYVYNITSEEYPLFNTIFENHIKGDQQLSNFARRRIVEGITATEKAAISLAEKGLAEHITDSLKHDILTDVIDIKGDFLFNLLEGKISSAKFNSIIKEILYNSPYSKIELNEIRIKIADITNIDIYNLLDEWYDQQSLPGYIIEKIDNYKFTEGDREKYQVKFTISNKEDVSGVIKLSFYSAGGRGGGPGGGRRFNPFGGRGDEVIDERIIFIDPKTTIEYGIVLEEEPRRMNLNTILSLNLPLDIEKTFEEFEERKKVKGISGSRIIDNHKGVIPGEIVVDNEDSTFTYDNVSQKSMLKKLLEIGEDRDKYQGVRFWNPPNNWTATINSDYYGKYIHSAHFMEMGDGSKSAFWNTEIKNSGYYDVYVHVTFPRAFGRRGNSGNGEYHYKVHHDDGVEEVTVQEQSSEQGWNLLGRYYFSEGSAKIEITNEGKGSMVFADAVKWVMQ